MHHQGESAMRAVASGAKHGKGPVVKDRAKNVLGTELAPCGQDPLTGFYRDGCCHTGAEDLGRHVVCAEVTEAFLAFSKARGNDLTRSGPGFPGLRPGDRWCLCAARWREAWEAGVAPPIFVEATHERALEIIDRTALLAHALDIN